MEPYWLPEVSEMSDNIEEDWEFADMKGENWNRPGDIAETTC